MKGARYRRAEEVSPKPHAERVGSSVLGLIRSHGPSLSDAESAVAELVLADPRAVVPMSIDALAGSTGVSTSSVLRFCQRIGYHGYKDFKLALAAEVGSRVAVLPDEIESTDTPMQIARKVFSADVQALSQSLAMLDEAAFEASLDALDAADRIEVYGIGSSAPIAMDAYYRLLRIGLPASVVVDAHMQAVSASQLRRGQVAFVISHTGRTTETLNAAELARAAGATVIGLTSFFDTPLIDVAHIALITATGESAFRVEAMASRIAHLSVVDALYVALAMRRFDHAVSTLQTTSTIIEKRRVE